MATPLVGDRFYSVTKPTYSASTKKLSQAFGQADSQARPSILRLVAAEDDLESKGRQGKTRL